jgi:phosphoribosylaminoimidazole-succinocarboxamide synthase
MGSVKDLVVIKKPTESALGVGEFHFSDRYSVFDWGEMPDHIEGKGAALCLIGAYCFEQLEEKNIKTHYRGLVTPKGETVAFEELKQPTDTMEINLVNVIKPKPCTDPQGKLTYNYGSFTRELTNFLIPLEIIYRNGLPEGSSIFKRLKKGTTTPKDLGLNHYPKPGEKLSNPIFDVSTKLEEKDRYVTWEEARKIAGLTIEEDCEVKTVLLQIDNVITALTEKAGLQNEDGKIELAFDSKRNLIVVDVIGTPDECRFTYETVHVSKEVAREFYRKTEWYRQVEEAKKTAEEKGIADWKSLCLQQPPKLDPNLRKIIGEMYMATANEMTNHKFFDAPPLAQVVNEYLEYTGGKE